MRTGFRRWRHKHRSRGRWNWNLSFAARFESCLWRPLLRLNRTAALLLKPIDARGQPRNLFCQSPNFVRQVGHARTLLHLFARHQVPDCTKFPHHIGVTTWLRRLFLNLALSLRRACRQGRANIVALHRSQPCAGRAKSPSFDLTRELQGRLIPVAASASRKSAGIGPPLRISNARGRYQSTLGRLSPTLSENSSYQTDRPLGSTAFAKASQFPLCPRSPGR